MSIEQRLREKGIVLPPAPAPAANYVPTVTVGNLIFVAGQVPFGPDGKLQFIGKVGAELSVEQGYQAARLCGLNCLAQLQAAAGSLERIKHIVRVGGFVNATPDFTKHPEVINGASDLFVEVLGEIGRHARAAVGSGSLPRGVAAEVELVAAI
ncbi:MAG: RidA family protein [Candidatus Lambdaproteobacteria bacterium]|nr:RidA family protein [Candidatus Lambdaproteobacteria bacterium]